MTRIERMEYIQKLHNLNDADFAKKIDISKQSYYNMKNSLQDVSDKALIGAIEAFPNINARWIATGIGKAEKDIATLEKTEQQLTELLYLKDKIIRDKEVIIEAKDKIIALLNAIHTS